MQTNKLSDIWPTNERVKVFACLEHSDGSRQWLLKDYSDSRLAQEFYDRHRNCRFVDFVATDARILYVYLDEAFLFSDSEHMDHQISLYE